MKYGEILYTRRWFLSREFASYRFRFEAVPFIRKRKYSWFRCWYKTPKTINERRQVCGNEEYVRGRRNVMNLPEAWDDRPRADGYDKKSWKKSFKCRKQWGKHVKKNCYC
jgi:hypothetical protein